MTNETTLTIANAGTEPFFLPADGGDPARLMRFRKIESADGRLAWAFDDLVYLEPGS